MAHKKSSNHIIYKLSNTITGEIYVGLTIAKHGRNYIRSVRGRFNRHVCRANRESKDWNLCNSLRTYGRQSFTYDVLDVIRTKQVAHQVELAYIKSLNPHLNSTL